LGGVAGHLAAQNTRQRAHLLAGVLAPVIVLTSASVGTLMLVGIDGRTLSATGVPTADSDTINLLNNVVVAMMSLFAAIMVVNSFAAVLSHRRAELHRLWLLGATPSQVRSSVLAEAVVVGAAGIVLGLLASLATIIPFGVARHEGVVPDGQLWLPPLVAIAVAVLTLAAARSAVRRTARPDRREDIGQMAASR
jgi:putative ABC transport system permease protein